MTAEYVAKQDGPWLPGIFTSSECCPHYEACPPCARGDGHRGCWGEAFTWRHGPNAVSRHEHAVGRLLGYGRHVLLYVYEAHYPHHAMCGCAEQGHPGAGSVDTYEGRGDRAWLQHRGLPVADVIPDPDPDQYGTPSLF